MTKRFLGQIKKRSKKAQIMKKHMLIVFLPIFIYVTCTQIETKVDTKIDEGIETKNYDTLNLLPFHLGLEELNRFSISELFEDSDTDSMIFIFYYTQLRMSIGDVELVSKINLSKQHNFIETRRYEGYEHEPTGEIDSIIKKRNYDFDSSDIDNSDYYNHMFYIYETKEINPRILKPIERIYNKTNSNNFNQDTTLSNTNTKFIFIIKKKDKIWMNFYNKSLPKGEFDIIFENKAQIEKLGFQFEYKIDSLNGKYYTRITNPHYLESTLEF